MYADVLRFEGYDVSALDDAEALLEEVHQRRPDLILLDALLPDACGFELCGDLRMMDDARLTPIILVGGREGDEHKAVRALLCGADDYLASGERIQELKARVRVQLRNRRDRELLQWAREQRATFRTAALVDPLTAIANRRAAERALSEALGRKDPLVVLLGDIDHFKSVNDTYGHQAGDEVLKRVAACFDKLVRRDDLVARFGGEEFVVLLRGARADQAPAIADRFRKSVACLDLTGTTVPGVTVSFGAAAWDGSFPAPTREAIVEVADVALYEAKNAGRNRVVVRQISGPKAEPTTSSEEREEEKVA